MQQFHQAQPESPEKSVSWDMVQWLGVSNLHFDLVINATQDIYGAIGVPLAHIPGIIHLRPVERELDFITIGELGDVNPTRFEQMGQGHIARQLSLGFPRIQRRHPNHQPTSPRSVLLRRARGPDRVYKHCCLASAFQLSMEGQVDAGASC